MLYLPNITIRTIQIKKKKKWNDIRTVLHYLSWLIKQKGHIFIDNKSEVHFFNKKNTETVNKEDKCTTLLLSMKICPFYFISHDK